jgi:hypothetical protein
MIDRDAAWQAAEDWCAAWNRRDLDAVMEHYADDVVLTSPVAVVRLGLEDGTLHGKEAVRDYFALGMQAPGLNFELLDVLLGVDALAILYRRENGALVLDAAELDAAGKVRRVRVYRGEPRN